MTPTVERTPARADALGLTALRRRATLWLLGLLGLGLATMVVATGVGAVSVPPGETLSILAYRLGLIDLGDWSPAREAIIWEVRLPRVVLGALVGAGLAVCGVALQAMVRNVLADPSLLGISSGASCGAAASLLFGFGAGWGAITLPGAAFLGALGASLLVFVVARGGGRITSTRLLLSGVAVGYALHSATSFLVFASGSAEGARSVLFWLLGSLGLAAWDGLLAAVAVVVLVTVPTLWLLSSGLDALAAGDDTAQALGFPPERLRLVLLALVSLCIGVLVAASGAIGLVGLVVPHLARRAVGAGHARVLPTAALMGAIGLVWADLAARTLLQPQEIPIGILTAMVGAPFLLVLIRRMHAQTA